MQLNASIKKTNNTTSVATASARRVIATAHRRPTTCVVSASSTTDAPTTKAGRVKLGKTGLEVAEVGVGAWSWGDRSGYWAGWTKDGSKAAYEAALAAGMDHIDTAEVYGNGLSEQFVGEFIKETGTKPFIATKFAPLPWRQTPGSLVSACEASLKRLGVPQVGLYLQHWPGFLFNTWSNDAYLEGLARVYEKGLAQSVGVSNFNSDRVRNAARNLEARGGGLCLACNQVQYSLLYRAPERNGVLEACNEYGVSLVAYSPICQGLLSGKYSKENPPQGPRRFIFTDQRYSSVVTLLDVMKKIGEERGGKTCTQVALNWTLCKGTIPIPGAKNAQQIRELSGAFGWRLTDGEVAELDAASNKIPTSLGAPFENW